MLTRSLERPAWGLARRSATPNGAKQSKAAIGRCQASHEQAHREGQGPLPLSANWLPGEESPDHRGLDTRTAHPTTISTRSSEGQDQHAVSRQPVRPSHIFGTESSQHIQQNIANTLKTA